MKTLDLAIIAAGIASLVACAAAPRHTAAPQAPATIYVPEQTIVADAPAHAAPVFASEAVLTLGPVTFVGVPRARIAHAETDAEHVARLMTATPEMVSCAGCVARKPGESMSGRVSRLGDR